MKKFPKKYSRVTGLIYKVQNILHPKICLSLYNTLILPHINYCNLSWGKENDAILLLQKRAVRAIASAGYRSHSEHLFKFYNLLKVNDIYKQRLLVFYYNILNKVISSNFNNFIPAFSEASSVYPIRNPQKQIPKHSHKYIKLTCRYQVAILVNEIISNADKYYNTIIAELIDNMENVSVASFKKSIKLYFLNDYSYVSNLNCYNCKT